MKEIHRKSLLYKTGVEYGDYTVNHAFGCAHGCRFPCYAFNMAKRFGNVKNIEEWIEPKIVSNAIELLDYELPKLKNKIKSVHLCFTTDPFMEKFPEVGEMSLKIINRINKEKIKCTILTKSSLPDYLLNTDKTNEYGITLVSLNEEFRKEYEQFSSEYINRIKSLKKMHDNGFKTWVSIEPYPTPNMVEQNLLEILNEVDFVDYIVFGRLHYNKKVSEYKGHKEFYNDCAKTVINFCENKNIKYHIKEGTITED